MASSVLAKVDREDISSRSPVTPVLRALAFAIVVAIATASYILIARQGSGGQPYNPLFIALLLVGNLIAGSALLVLVGRTVARRRAARLPGGGDGQLHVRLVALFSIAAAVPLILVTITASLLFQYGSQWSSEAAQAMLTNSRELVRDNYKREIDGLTAEMNAMRGDVASGLRAVAIDDPQFSTFLGEQTYRRALSEAMIARRGDKDPLAVVNPYNRPLVNVVTPAMMNALDRGEPLILVEQPDRRGILLKLDYGPNTYLYGSRIFERQLAAQMRRSDAIAKDYGALRSRSRSLQLRFNAALLGISLLIVGIAVWIALRVADRLVRPVSELVGAAGLVADGDLSARVTETSARDEIGTLARAFNTMTSRIQQQNATLEQRRALIEAVMAGVSAGVVATDAARVITIANSSAIRLLDGAALPGQPLASAAPELDLLVREGQREAIVQVGGGEGEPRTLAVRIARADATTILTFDDITQQQLDQRRAAWADVARRIAHEIKNPLTPIQLAAERLQRRYGSKLDGADTTFQKLTDTIVRQVGDLRRMVDEFSSFARMPKPVFRDEPLADIARQTLFLHEVAHPAIRFELVGDDPGPHLVCDRRQIGQALTNLVKNAAEAIEAGGAGEGTVTLALGEAAGKVCIEVGDTGVGLPPDRDRIVEPYVTHRPRGTGLGLAIVKKIVEEHLGTMTFSDRDGGGATVTLTFDAAALRELESAAPSQTSGEELAQLIPMRT